MSLPAIRNTSKDTGSTVYLRPDVRLRGRTVLNTLRVDTLCQTTDRLGQAQWVIVRDKATWREVESLVDAVRVAHLPDFAGYGPFGPLGSEVLDHLDCETLAKERGQNGWICLTISRNNRILARDLPRWSPARLIGRRRYELVLEQMGLDPDTAKSDKDSPWLTAPASLDSSFKSRCAFLLKTELAKCDDKYARAKLRPGDDI